MTPPRPSTSPRLAMMAVFGAFGAAVGALAGSMPAVVRSAGLDAELFGLGLTISTLATVTAMALGGGMARLISNRLALLCALPIFAALVMAYLMAQSPLWFFLAVIPMGFIFGVTDIFMNTEAAAIEHDMGRPVFTAFHACVSAGVAVMAIVSSFVSAMIGTWATGLICALCFASAWALVFRHAGPRPLAAWRREAGGAVADRRPLVLLGIAAGLIIAGETAALLWSARLLDELAPSLAAIAGLGAAFFGLCNAALRLPGDALRARFGDLPLMLGSLSVAVMGFAVLGFSASFGLSVAAFAAVGLGTAVLIPCVMALAAACTPGNRAGGLGFVSLLSGLPRILAPWGFGWIAGGFGTNVAFGLVAIGLCAALVLIAVLRGLSTGLAPQPSGPGMPTKHASSST